MAAATERQQFRYSQVKRPREAFVDEIEGHENHLVASRSWRAITTMVAALLLGLVFATAQHLVNDHLNERAVDSVALSSRWVSRINTALAFLVKTCLAVTVGVAFIQRLWLKMHDEPLRVLEIDALTGILGNIFNFFGTSVWFHHPLLTLMALTAWVLPIATIITPGSISLNQKPETNVTLLQVPQYDWLASEYATLPIGGGYGQVYASLQTYKIAYTSAMTGDSLSLPSRFQNQSYTLSFHGPAVQCGIASSTVREMISELISTENNGSGTLSEYVSWVYGDEANHGLTLNLTANTGQVAPTEAQFFSSYASLDETSSVASKIYTMVRTGSGAMTTECDLYNATYEVDFVFAYPEQKHDISSVQIQNGIAAKTFLGPDGVNSTGSVIASYAGVMDAFGKLLVGYASYDQYGENITFQTSYNLLSINWFDANSTYQGLESLFRNITLSFLSNSIFTKNSGEAAHIPVTATFWPVKYVYSPWQLWLPYGLGSGAALICLLIGLHAFIQNEGSYQNIFSTFVRATSHHELRNHVDSHDNFADPLPRDLANTKVQLRKFE